MKGIIAKEDPSRRRTAARRRWSSIGVSLCVCFAMLFGVTGVANAVVMIRSDLDFILQQIKIAEAHAAGGQLRGTGPFQIPSPLLPFGLRTVNGQFNNIVPGQEMFGASDRLFPRVLEPIIRNGEALTFDPDGPGPSTVGDPTNYSQTSGIVVDSRPRTISNLIVDASTNNPAAVAAASQTPGSELVACSRPACTSYDDSFFIPNQAPDVGLSAPYNSWFTLFGQFFDHGLDLTNKGRSGTVVVPLRPDDPLYVEGSPTNFMLLTRAMNLPGPDGIVGDNPATPLVNESADDVHEHTNQTTPFVDQNQTYTSHPSHQVFLREYELNGSGTPVSNGRMLDSAIHGGGLATWGEVKDQATAMLGIELDDQDVLNLPLLVTDLYGKFIPDPGTGFAQIVTDLDPMTVASGTPSAPVDGTTAVRTNHAFLDDIAHSAVPFGDLDGLPGGPRGALTPDPDAAAGNDPGNTPGVTPQFYDDELLDAHFITGDGRGNENIGLTAVHHVFHAEHNFRVGDIKSLILTQPDAFIDEWQLGTGVTGVWDGERLFQAARFVTEMEYQHLVFEEFARKVQPQVNVFAGYETQIDPAIVAEFAHTVYRFGHSMLTETVARTNADGTLNDVGLIEAFLNPLAFNDGGAAGTLSPEAAAGGIARGMTSQVGNEIDEFVTSALRNNLVGLPLDLATINMTRGRDTGVPGLNAARRQFYAATSHAALQPYESWTDFRLGIRHPESLVNFIAAYGTHAGLTAPDVDTLVEKRAVAGALVDGGSATINMGTPDERIFTADDADRTAFLDSTGPYANLPDGVTTTGVDGIDFWVGGLAEKQMPFGGLLGSTFNFVFETQMEKLQDGDRLYYLGRTVGLNFFTQLEENSFAEMVMRTTDTTHLPFDIFSTPNFTFELANLGTSGPILNDPATPYDESVLLTRMPNGTFRFSGGEHVVFGGTGGPDLVKSSEGDDTLWGDGANDRLEGGSGNDAILGGPGEDILIDLFGDDNIKGGPGDDAINAGGGFDLILGGLGNDFVVGGSDPKETFAGGGDDFVIAGDSSDVVFGNEGNDWIEGGTQADALAGEFAAPFQDDPSPSNDVLIGDGGNDDLHGEGGDDIMVAGPGIEDVEGLLGFDWLTHRGDPQAADADLNRRVGLPPDLDAVRDRFRFTEGLSGWNKDDILRGDDTDVATLVGHELTNVGLIDGLAGVLGAGVSQFNGGNIILGGAGSDIIEGRGGDDIIDGDVWLNARISVRDPIDPNIEIQSVDSMTAIQAAVFAGTIKPSQLRIVREISTTTPGPADVDTAVFSDIRANYDISPNLNTTQMNVVHARGTLLDGTDTVKNVERLAFADQTVEVVPIATNTPAAGTVIISDTTPAEDQVLTATRAFNDADGVNDATVVFGWQVEIDNDVWATVGSGVTFAPGDGEVDSRLRVVATFQDGDGVFESVRSAPTAPVTNVNDPPTGTVNISDTAPVEDQPLAATRAFNDADGVNDATVVFGWQVETAPDVWAAVGSGATFTPGDGQVGSRLRAIATFQDGTGVLESVTSAPTAAVTNVNDPPTGSPALDDATPEVGVPVTASTAPIADADGLAGVTFSYRWQQRFGTAAFTNIAGATSASFTPTQAQVGWALRAVVTFTDNHGTVEQRFSEATGVVVGPPGAPAIGTASAGNATATVNWTAPANNGSAITEYRVEVRTGATVVSTVTGISGTATSTVVGGLTNGTAYNFRVRAINAVGAGLWSDPSNTVIPLAPTVVTVPGAPTIGTASAGDASATVNWTAPASDGGSAISEYRIQVRTGTNVVRTVQGISAAASSSAVTGLTNGTAYNFRVRAINAIGMGALSAPSNTVTPTGGPAVSVPGKPVIGTAVAGVPGGAITATANWAAPTSTGGSPITGYRVKALRMSASGSVLGTTISIEPGTSLSLSMTLPVTGNYRFVVQAINAAGTGAASARSNLVAGR